MDFGGRNVFLEGLTNISSNNRGRGVRSGGRGMVLGTGDETKIDTPIQQPNVIRGGSSSPANLIRGRGRSNHSSPVNVIRGRGIDSASVNFICGRNQFRGRGTGRGLMHMQNIGGTPVDYSVIVEKMKKLKVENDRLKQIIYNMCWVIDTNFECSFLQDYFDDVGNFKEF